MKPMELECPKCGAEVKVGDKTPTQKAPAALPPPIVGHCEIIVCTGCGAKLEVADAKRAAKATVLLPILAIMVALQLTKSVVLIALAGGVGGTVAALLTPLTRRQAQATLRIIGSEGGGNSKETDAEGGKRQ